MPEQILTQASLGEQTDSETPVPSTDSFSADTEASVVVLTPSTKSSEIVDHGLDASVTEEDHDSDRMSISEGLTPRGKMPRQTRKPKKLNKIQSSTEPEARALRIQRSQEYIESVP